MCIQFDFSLIDKNYQALHELFKTYNVIEILVSILARL